MSHTSTAYDRRLTPTNREFAVVCRAVEAARKAGLRLPEFEVTWFDRDFENTCLGYTNAAAVPVVIGLQRGQSDGELLRTMLHELQHASDVLSGAWHRLSKAERERRAEAFVFRVVDL